MSSVLDSAEPFIAHNPTRVSGAQDATKLDGYEVGQVRSWLMALRDGASHSFNAKRYGASASSDDNTAAFADAEEDITSRGGGVLVFPEGTWRGLLRPASKMVIRGAGRATILKAPAGSNAAVVEGKNFATLTGKSYAPTDINAGDNYVGLRDLTIDGDKATQTSGWGIRLWGRSYSWSNVIVQNCKSGGIWTEFTTHPDAGIESLLESFFDQIKTHGNDGDGWLFRGPHDSILTNFITVGNAGWGLQSEHVTGSYNGTVSGHGWNSWGNVIGSYKFGAGVGFLANSIASGQGGIGIDISEARGAGRLIGIHIGGHATGIILRGTQAMFSGKIESCSENAMVWDGAVEAVVDVSGADNANAISVVADPGANIIRGTFVVPVGGSLVTGSFNDTDIVSILSAGAVTTPVMNTPSGNTTALKSLTLSPVAGLALAAKAADSGTHIAEFSRAVGTLAVRIDSTGRIVMDDSAIAQSQKITAWPVSVIDPVAANHLVVPASTADDFTIPAPSYTSPTGQRLTITVKNVSGGALGTATWDAAYKMAAWTNPADGHSRSVDFAHDGTSWVEVSRTPADVPN